MLIVFLFSRAWISSRAREDDDAETLLIRDYQAARINKIFSDDDLRGVIRNKSKFFFSKATFVRDAFLQAQNKMCVLLSFFLPSFLDRVQSVT